MTIDIDAAFSTIQPGLTEKAMSEIDVERARFNMIEQQIRTWEVLDQRVLDVMTAMPREDFVPPRYRRLAFADVAIPLGHGQCMMHPKVEGRLLQALNPSPADNVLEVGTGSGYLCACLAKMGAFVTSVDIFPRFSEGAHRALRAHAIDNVDVHTGDAALGWGDRTYHAIALTGSLPRLSSTWKRQLKIGGRLFAIIGQSPIMEALLVTRTGEQEWIQESLFETDLPALVNATQPEAFSF